MDDQPLPSCIRPAVALDLHPELAADLRFYDCWQPNRCGTPILDFENGVALADFALAGAWEAQSPKVPIFIIGAMRDKRHCADIEAGFLWAVAHKAMHGQLPPAGSLPPDLDDPTLHDDWRKGANLAAYDVEMARGRGDPGEITRHLKAGVRDGERYADFGGYCWAVISAATAACGQ